MTVWFPRGFTTTRVVAGAYASRSTGSGTPATTCARRTPTDATRVAANVTAANQPCGLDRWLIEAFPMPVDLLISGRSARRHPSARLVIEELHAGDDEVESADRVLCFRPTRVLARKELVSERQHALIEDGHAFEQFKNLEPRDSVAICDRRLDELHPYGEPPVGGQETVSSVDALRQLVVGPRRVVEAMTGASA